MDENTPTTEEPTTTEPTTPPPVETDAPADPPADPPADEGDEDEPRPGSRAAQRIQELVAQAKRDRELMTEYAEHWRQLALRNGQPAPSTPAAAAPTDDDPAPTLDNFDSTEKWAAELTAWTQREAERRAAAAVEKTLSTRDQQQAQTAVAQTYNGRLEEFEKTVPDARKVIANPVFTAVLQRQPVITEVVMASEHGPALAHHLASNPVEADRIARMTPVQAAAAIGRIEAKLAAAPPPAPRRPTVSNAPPPPAPISGTGSPAVDLSTVSIDEYVRIRAKQRAERRR